MKTNSSIHDPRHMTIISVLKKARTDQGLTQDDVAERLGVNRVYISKTEICERNISVLELLDYCKALDIDALSIIRTIIGEELPKELYENDTFLLGYANGFLHGKGEVNVNSIPSRVSSKENKAKDGE